jgi:hypothetical protein
VAIAVAAAALFCAWHWCLLTPAGRVRGFDSDAAILALMGKKMLEGRGFDFFFWGQNYVGPLTSTFIAAAGLVTGRVNPLALRLGAFTEVFLAVLVTAWGVARLDRRAGIATLVLLCLTPPVVLGTMISPSGAEMGLLTSALIAAVVLQQLTTPPSRRGCLASPHGQLAFGLLAGLAWWMNQQVVFVLLGAVVVFGRRSQVVERMARGLRLLDRLRLRGAVLGWRRMPGVVEAAVWVMCAGGLLLLVANVALEVAGPTRLPFLVGRYLDPLLLVLVPQLTLPLALGEWRRWHVAPSARERYELGSALRFALGAIIGYLPVWLGGLLGWYERSYVFGFQPQPSLVPQQLLRLGSEVAPRVLGLVAGEWGVAWGIGLTVAVVVALRRVLASSGRLFLASAVLSNVMFFLFVPSARAHYFLGTVGMLFGLAALGCVEIWGRGALAARIVTIAIAVAAAVSVAGTASARQAAVLAQADPLPLLQRVHERGCVVCYADYWLAYRYRLLDGGRTLWITYRGQNRSRAEARRFQRVPGQRCLVLGDGTVETLPGDLPLRFAPPDRRDGPRHPPT